MWLKYLMQILQLAPIVVAGIEHIHHSAPGATKKDLALQSLGLASGVAGAVLPEHQQTINAATELAGNVIDGVVKTLNAAGVLQRANAAGKAAAATVELPAPIAAVPAAVAPVATDAGVPAAASVDLGITAAAAVAVDRKDGD